MCVTTLARMGRRLVERRLAQVSARVRALREELRMVDEQLRHLTDEADELGLRALVSETPAAGLEHRQARSHADAMARHREHVLATIAELERSQDQLLDRLTPG